MKGGLMSNGYTDDGGRQHRGTTDHDGADQRLVIIGFGEEPDKVVQCNAFYLIGEYTLGQNRIEGIDNEQAHTQYHRKLCEKPEVKFDLSKSLLHRESTSSESAS